MNTHNFSYKTTSIGANVLTYFVSTISIVVMTILLFFSLSIFASQHTPIQHGEALYKTHCEECHGKERKGGIGLPLGMEKIALLSNSYLKQTVKLGRPGRVMPALQLTDSKYQALIQYLRQGLPAPNYRPIKIIGNSDNGKVLYNRYCLECHNTPLIGGEGVGKNYSWEKKLGVAPPALANSGFLASISDSELKQLIKNSIPGSEMPGYKLFLTSNQVNDVIAYIKSYSGKTREDAPEEPLRKLSFVFDSAYDLETTVKKIQNAIKAANFRMYAPRKLLEDLRTSTSVYSKQVVVRFCNFERMLEFIKIEPRLGIVLPCRITIIENGGGEVKVVIENYKRTVAKFNNQQISIAAEELITNLTEVIEEALW